MDYPNGGTSEFTVTSLPNKKAAEILATYKELVGGAQDVSPDLLFSTAVNLVCPWHWMGTATGVEAMRAASRGEDNDLIDPASAAREAAAEIEAAEGKAISA